MPLPSSLRAVYKSKSLSEYTQNLNVITKQKGGYWNEKENRRDFFDRLGKRLQITKVEEWYRFGAKEVKELEGGKGILKHFEGSFVNAITQTYTDHDWKVLTQTRVIY